MKGFSRAALAGVLGILIQLASLLPLGVLVWDYTQGYLAINPIRDATLRTGKIALVLLVLSLACRPAYSLTGAAALLRLRRTLGLYAFGYAALHLIIVLGPDLGLDPALIRENVLEKRFALAGLGAFLILLPLAATSTRSAMTRLGRKWRTLHRAVYLAGALAVLHYLWAVKADFRGPATYGAVVALLLLLRLPPVSAAISRWRRLRAAVPKTPCFRSGDLAAQRKRHGERRSGGVEPGDARASLSGRQSANNQSVRQST